MTRTTPAVVSMFGVNPTRIGGNEAFARELSRQLSLAGWASILCMLGDPPGAVRQYLDLPNVTLETFCGAPVTWTAIRDFAGILRRHRPAILHLHFIGLLTPFPWMARLAGTRRVFFTDQGSKPEGAQPRAPAPWKRATARFINVPMTSVIAVSEFNRRFLAAVGTLPAEKQVCIPNSVDLTRPAPEWAGQVFRRRFGVAPERRIVAQVSMMIQEKGVGDLLDAAKLVVAEERDAHFMLVGEGPQRTEYASRADAMGLGNHVTFTGQILDPIGEGVFASADVLCQVSRWQEAFGWTITEAMAFRKPVVATRVGGIPEIVEHGVTGYLAERGDARQIADYVLSLLRDPDMRQRMGAAGRAVVEEKFDLRKNVARLIQLYGIS